MKYILATILSLSFSNVFAQETNQYKIVLTANSGQEYVVELTISEDGRATELSVQDDVLVQVLNYFGEKRIFASTTGDGEYLSAEFLVDGSQLTRSCMISYNNKTRKLVSSVNNQLYILSKQEQIYKSLIDQGSVADRRSCEDNLSYEIF